MAKAKADIIGKVTLLNVRLSFEKLYEPNRSENDDGTIRETWGANFLIPKEDAKEMQGVFKGKKMPILKAIKAAGDEAKAKKWGDDPDKWPKIKDDRKFFRDGDQENWDGYAGNHYASANAQLNERPSVITNRKDGNGKWIEAEGGGKNAPYSGCYVNAVLVIWAQDNKHGKRLNAQVKAVQFFRDGEPFGGTSIDVDEEFDDDMAGTEGSIGGDFSDDGEDDDDDMI